MRLFCYKTTTDGMTLTTLPETRSDTGSNSLPLKEIRSDIRLLLDRIEITKDAIREQRVACDDVVFVCFHRVEANDTGNRAAVPFERRCARGLFASRDGFREHIALDEGLQHLKLSVASPKKIRSSRQ